MSEVVEYKSIKMAIMKRLKEKIIMLFALVSLVMLIACDDDSKKEWGYAKVYMPQASVLNGGINNNYPVPLNNNPATNNYVIDSTTNTLKIILGVYRSGLQELKNYKVNIEVDRDATNKIVTETSKGISLPDDVYTLPTEVSVSDGERQAIFYLSVDLNKMLANYSEMAKNKICISVRILNPSRYELNLDLAKTDIIIDGSAFLPAPSIVKGKDFAADSEQYWTKVNLNGDVPVLENAIQIKDGALMFDYGSESVTRSTAIYQAITLIEGAKYKFSSKASGTGASAAEMIYVIANEKPVEGIDYDFKSNKYFSALDVWMASPNLGSAFEGTFPQLGKWENGIERTSGEFTANFTEGYIIVILTTWNGNIGKIVIDNINIEEI